MRRPWLLLVPFASLSLVVAQQSPGNVQRQRRTTLPNGTANTGAYHEPAATMHGVLHHLTNKQLVLITEGDESVEILRTRKTKFFRGGKEIKPSEVALGSIVSVDVGKFPDLTPQAVNVMVDSPPIDGAVAAPAKSKVPADRLDDERPAEESSDVSPSSPKTPPPATPAPPQSR